MTSIRALVVGAVLSAGALGAGCAPACDDAWIGEEGCPSACYVLSARAVDVARACTVEDETTICARADEEPRLGASCVVDEQTGVRYWAASGVRLGAGWRGCTSDEEAEAGPDDACME